jgi:hypothetical protein
VDKTSFDVAGGWLVVGCDQNMSVSRSITGSFRRVNRRSKHGLAVQESSLIPWFELYKKIGQSESSGCFWRTSCFGGSELGR